MADETYRQVGREMGRSLIHGCVFTQVETMSNAWFTSGLYRIML